MWNCQCECGNHIIVRGYALKSGHTTSCGCKKYSAQDLTGQKFGRLSVLKKIRYDNAGHAYWLCQCECGTLAEIRGSHLINNNIVSCGCLQSSKGEDKIKQILQNNNIDFICQKTFETCRFSDTNALARFDFYLPDYNILIEYDGEQHFNETSRWYTEKIPLHDQYKNKWCKENNILLIRIPYTHYKNIQLEDLLSNSNFILY